MTVEFFDSLGDEEVRCTTGRNKDTAPKLRASITGSQNGPRLI
jgi:hypothetical protein